MQSIAFTPDGDWVLLFGFNGVWASNAGQPAVREADYAVEGSPAQFQVRRVCTLRRLDSFLGAERKLVRWWRPGWRRQRLRKSPRAASALRSIAFADGGWVLLVGKTGVYYRGIPEALAKVLDDAIRTMFRPLRGLCVQRRLDLPGQRRLVDK